MRGTFVDSGAFIALLSRTDQHHGKAKAVYTDLVRRAAPLVTTSLVVAETCNWLLRDKAEGHDRAVRFGEFIRSDWLPAAPGEPAVPVDARSIVVYSGPEIEKEAWRILAQFDTVRFSFTDCVSFAVMRALGLTRAFTFDSHFDILGFERL